MLNQLLSEAEAVAEVKKHMLNLQGNGWMVAFWMVREEKEKEKNTLIFPGRTTWKFPVGDYEKCIEMLKNHMEEEVKAGKPPIPAPLDVADWLKPKTEIVRSCEGSAENMESVENTVNAEVDEIDRLFNPSPKEE